MNNAIDPNTTRSSGASLQPPASGTRNPASRILIVEDEANMRALLHDFLTSKGYIADEAESAEEALDKFRPGVYDLVMSDIRLPGMTGLDLLSRIIELDPLAIVIVVTAFDSGEVAIDAVKRGAYDYITKPFNLEELHIVISRGLEKKRLRNELEALRNGLKDGYRGTKILTQNPEMISAIDLVDDIAASDLTVLITGESGTGKELIARAIHEKSSRSKGPLKTLNCAAIPGGLLESELFGHEKGSFTGASNSKMGKFEMADKGTLFLDEIGEMDITLQAKVLRAIEHLEIERVGGLRSIKVDVRIVAATNKDLMEEVDGKRFREDLFYRLNVVPIHLPPLRQRKEDIPLLSDQFLHEACRRGGKSITGFTPEAMDMLMRSGWPGNIRELKNVVEGAAAVSQGDMITAQSLRPFMKAENGVSVDLVTEASLKDTMENVEKSLIIRALEKGKGKQTDAARILGLSPKNLWSKIRKHKIRANEGE